MFPPTLLDPIPPESSNLVDMGGPGNRRQRAWKSYFKIGGENCTVKGIRSVRDYPGTGSDHHDKIMHSQLSRPYVESGKGLESGV